jgi:DNA-binding SARP family transcriptional activator
MPAPVVHLHGLPQVRRDDGRAVPLSAREAALLAWLHLEGPSPRAVLAGWLWPDGDERRARANLRQTLVRLRRSAGELLVEHDGVMRLADGVAVAPAGTGEAAAQRLLGPLEFDDAPELAEWLQARREAASREQRRQRLAEARRALERGAFDAALAQAEAVLAVDAAVEEAHRVRMEVFYLRGDRAAAITAWDDCRDALRTAYGIGPSAATNELGRLVLAAEAASGAASAGVAAAVLPAALRRPPRLVGRDDAWAALQRAQALGQGVAVAGPAGIGKSRLLAQAAAALEPALVVGARPGDAHLPGVVVSRLVAAAVERFAPALDGATRADIARLLPGGPARPSLQAATPAAAPGAAIRTALEHRRVLASVARALQACHGRGMRLLVVDDLQFADELSMQALAVVVGRWLAEPDAAAALPLLGCRPDELRPAAVALVQMLAGSTRALRLDLAPLTVADVQALLETLPLQTGEADGPDRRALAEALHQRVGGNPAFVLESVKALWADGPQALAKWRAGQPLVVPATLRESLRQRLGRLGADALQLAQLAAVAQDDFSLPLAASALGRPPLALAPLFAELEAAQVLDGIRFSHDLVAEAARAALPQALVAPLHQLVAEHLRAQGGTAARIAGHRQQAGDVAAAAPWHLRAGQAARDRWQLAEAARSHEAAAEGLELLRRQGRAAADSIAGTWLQAARWWTAVSEYGQALRALDRGDAASPSPAERLELQASRVIVLLNRQQVADAAAVAAALAGQLTSDADSLAPDRLAAVLFACVAVAPYSARPQDLVALCEALRGRCERGPAPARLSFHLALGATLNWLGWPAQAAVELARARELADAAGDHGSIVNITHQQLRRALMQGDADAATAAADDCARAVQAGGYGRSFRLHALAAQALAAVSAGRPQQAWAALQVLQAESEPDGLDPATDAEVMASRALAWCALGGADRVTAWPQDECWAALVRWRVPGTPQARLDAAVAMARRWPADEGVMGWRRRVLGAALAPPPVHEAEALVQALRERSLWPLARQAHLAAAAAALAEGSTGRAAAHAREALALADGVDPYTDDAAAVWLHAAQRLQAAGAAAEAETARQAGRQWLRQTAATLQDEAVRAAWLAQPVHRALLQGG